MKKLVLLFVMVIAITLTGCGNTAKIPGSYECYNLDGGSEDGYGSFAFNLEFKKDKTFEYSQGNGVARGKYSYERVKKETQKGTKEYSVTLSIESVTIDGQTEEYTSNVDWELALDSKTNEAVIINNNNYSTFVCKKK